MRVIIAGGRDFDDEVFAFEQLDRDFGKVLKSVTVISGGARGADNIGERWAKARGVKLVVRKAKWDEHGKAAGPIRNMEMITEDKGSHLVAFHDGESRGTRHMIDSALKHSLWVRVVRYEKKKAA